MIDTAHAIDNRPVVLDESDSDDLEFAESVDLGAPADFGVVPGLCGLDISQFIASRNHVDRVIGPYAGLGHDNDSIVLRGPITIALWYIHAAEEIHPGVPTELTTPEIITIPAGETEKFLHVDGRDEHPGDWNMYIWLLSINR